jgi:dipeptidyl aminopeptidase/acylaminoacyl peptidase
MPPPSLAFLAGGRLHVKHGDTPVRAFDSAFGQQVRDRHAEIQRKHAWKAEGRGARFMSGLLWGMPERPDALQVAITSLTPGTRPGEVLYTLDTEGRTALCLFAVEDASERRLLHGSEVRIRDVRAAPGRPQIACSVLHADGRASLALMDQDGRDLREVTEGDAHDRFPSWAPGPGARLVYQSASVGRDGAGRFAAYGANEVHLLDLESGALETLATDPDHDFLSPRLDAQGNLYCVRRPRPKGGASFGTMLLDIVLIPARLLFAVFQYLNFFSARYTGKPLTTAGARQKAATDVRQMMVWSNLMEAEQGGPDEPQPAVPKSWQLVRIRKGERPQTMAEGVSAFDVADDGSILYSTGSAIHCAGPDGRHQHLVGGEQVEALVAL